VSGIKPRPSKAVRPTGTLSAEGCSHRRTGRSIERLLHKNNGARLSGPCFLLFRSRHADPGGLGGRGHAITAFPLLESRPVSRHLRARQSRWQICSQIFALPRRARRFPGTAFPFLSNCHPGPCGRQSITGSGIQRKELQIRSHNLGARPLRAGEYRTLSRRTDNGDQRREYWVPRSRGMTATSLRLSWSSRGMTVEIVEDLRNCTTPPHQLPPPRQRKILRPAKSPAREQTQARRCLRKTRKPAREQTQARTCLRKTRTPNKALEQTQARNCRRKIMIALAIHCRCQ
jgi:hypothetical protein